MSRTAIDVVTTFAVVNAGLIAVFLLMMDSSLRELGLRAAPAYRRYGTALTVAFVVFVTLRFLSL